MKAKNSKIRLNNLFLTVTGTFLLMCAQHILAVGHPDINSTDTTAMFSFYNAAGSFDYASDPNVHPNEREMKAGLLYDLENKRIVWQKEMNNTYPIASLTKMMVALLTVEDIRAGKIKWTDEVKWTRELVNGRGKKRHIVYENVKYTLEDIFKAAMIASNNEAAEQMARYVGGDVQTFVDRMNTRARELGMNSTYYGNPTGLPASARVYDNCSTPTDLLTLTMEMLKYEEILKVTGMGYADINNGKSTSIIRNHNHLTIDYKGEVDGMKTGYTKRAGFCLVATSNKCDQRLISIVLGARSPELRNEVVKNMLNDYYSSIGLDKLSPNCGAPSFATTSTSGGEVYRTKTSVQTYVVKKGETLASIAYRFNCSASDIKSWNKMRSGRVIPGRAITIYTASTEKIDVIKSDEEEDGTAQLDAATTADSPADPDTVAEMPKAPVENPVSVKTSQSAKPAAVAAKKQPASQQEKSKYIIYVVQPGDTLFSIAKRYDLPNVAQLKAVNKISKGRSLRVGAKLKVPVSS
jgi:D-alanyl-D-alanine carboxypeptidase (penicillin-binding protein 5/6)